MYTDITTVEEVFKRQKDQIDLQKVKDSLSFLPEVYSDGMLSLMVLQAATEVVNNDDPEVPPFDPNYNDRSQKKWGNWGVGGDSSGSGFLLFDPRYAWTLTFAYGGARLAMKDEPRTAHMKQYFAEHYKRLWLMLKKIEG